MSQILIPMSPGELIDKITILEIKMERIDSIEKKANVEKELSLLNKVWNDAASENSDLYSGIKTMCNDLKKVNETLWVIEDDLRDEEREKRFGERFVELARSVYFTNDKRAALKKDINLHLKSDIVEEKSYQDYE